MWLRGFFSDEVGKMGVAGRLPKDGVRCGVALVVGAGIAAAVAAAVAVTAGDAVEDKD